MSNTKTTIVAIPAFNAPVKKVVDAFNGVDKAATKLGDTVLSVAPSIPADKVDVFCSMVKAKLEASNPDKAGSIKTQVSYIRRVINAIVVDGREIEPGQSLRGIYESLPKAKTGGASHARKTDKAAGEKEETGESKTVTLSSAEKKALDINAAITTLFGTCNAELIAAVEYAVSHSGVFMSWAAASAKAAQLAELEAALDGVPTKAPAKRQSRKQTATA